MADRRLAIEITVEGDAERKFKDIGRAVSSAAKEIEAGSQKGATAIDKVGKSAASTEDQVKELEVAQKRAAKAADEMAASSGKSSSAVDKLGISYKQAGAGLALLGAGFTRWSQDARTHELTLIALQRVYGEATDSYIQFADHIQNTSIFSNDQALEAARIMSTLKLNYELTDAQIQQLIQTSADLATVSNVSLVDAATRVQSAIRGEA
ncbi:MAG: hypothetical protein KDJ36_16795, partial [Hyphomicrobiaceae bacterium]|nr:hypothetical protein [Hyphomicrobiaceae bacterium]